MPKAVELLRQGRHEELWQMCCGYLKLDIQQFMEIQERLLLEQLELLKKSPLGQKVMRGAKPHTLDEFRKLVPLTTYADYCPELEEKREDILPVKPESWVRTSGRSGEYKCRWIPITPAFSRELSAHMYGIGMISGSKHWGDSNHIPQRPRMVYTVAPRPYMSGAMTCMLEQQTPIYHLPSLEEAEGLSFEDRVKLGFKQALSRGMDYFFGMALALVTVGEKFGQSSGSVSIRTFLLQPRALLRLAKGKLKSYFSRRSMLPKDLWPVKGIITTGVDSWMYRDKIEKFWGRCPLDVYAGTEGGIYATQTWDYEGMTFNPNINFLEFIPEDEHFKWQMDRSYEPKTLLLNEVKAGECYELIITNFHGGVMVRYRIGDLVKITSLRNEKDGIELPQMRFERRADGLLNFVVIQFTEKQIWQAIEKTEIAYEDWMAYKVPGESVLHILIEPKDVFQGNEADIATVIRGYVLEANSDNKNITGVLEDLTDMFDFNVEVEILPKGSFAKYTAQKQAEGADLAHLKPPHINPSDEVLTLLVAKPEKAKAGITAEEDNRLAVQ
jgi:hypothetical protein